MNILLTGPTGMVGVETLRELRKRNLNVRVLELENERTQRVLEEFPGLDIVYGDLRDPNTVRSALDGIDVVIHLAAVIPPLADENPTLAEEVNVYGTKLLIEEMERKVHKPFLLYASSVSVYGDRLYGDDIDVTDPLIPSPFDEYAKTKIKAEELIRRSALNYSILRVSGVMGPRPGVNKKDRVDPLMYHMPLNTKLEFVTSRDAGYAFAEAINHQDVLNKNIYNLAGGKQCRTIYFDFMQRSLEDYGLDINKFPKYCFAEKNFHCGYYKDSDVLDDILHFQRDTLESYFEWMHFSLPTYQKWFVKLFQPLVIHRMIKHSDIYQGVLKNNIEAIKRFLHFNPNRNKTK